MSILKHFIVFLFLILTGNVGAQTFSKTFSYENRFESLSQCIVDDNGYLFIGVTIEDTATAPLRQALEIFKTDLDGNVLDSNIVAFDSLDVDAGYISGALKVNNTNYEYILSFAAENIFSDKVEGYVITLNNSLDAVWIEKYSIADTNMVLRSISSLSDSSFVIFGEVFNEVTQVADLFIGEIDTAGVLLHYTLYGDTENELIGHGIKSNDNHFLVSGRSQSFAMNHPVFVGNGTSGVVVKYDPQLQEVWSSILPSEGYNRAPILSEDGLFIQRVESPIEVTTSSFEYYFGQLDLLDGSILWSDTLRETNEMFTSRRIKSTSDGGIVILYEIESDTIDISISKIVKLNSMRIKEWERVYNPGTSSIARLSDFVEDQDGNLIFWGVTQLDESDDTWDNWVLKLNSEGCLSETDCGLATPIKPELVNDEFVVYPNPFSSHFSIAGIETNGGKIVSIMNSFGQTVVRKTFRNEDIIELSLEGFANGVYFLIVSDDKGDVLGKHTMVKN